MKKSLLALAIAGITTAPMVANAVNVSHTGQGDVLLFPYYNVNESNRTFVGFANTSNAGKIVKVRFREGIESEDVLDFQVFMSPHDHWTGVISKTGGNVTLTTGDSSCTVPTIPASGAPLITDRIHDDFTGDRLSRISEGHIEVFEIATIDDDYVGAGGTDSATLANLTAAITHGVDGSAPTGCATAVTFNQELHATAPAQRYSAETEVETASVEVVMNPPSNSLIGLAAVFNPTNGVYYPYSATALEDFASGTGAGTIFFTQTAAVVAGGDDLTSDEALYAGTLNVLAWDLPDLSTPTALESVAAAGIAGFAYAGGTSVTEYDFLVTDAADAPSAKRDAVTGALMASSVSNDYLAGSLYNTDWVFTFPGRYAYRTGVDATTTPDHYDLAAPFSVTTVPRDTGRACITVDALSIYNREETPVQAADVGFSPGATDDFQLCNEVNVISFNDESATMSSALSSVSSWSSYSNNFNYGWGSISVVGNTLTDEDTTGAGAGFVEGAAGTTGHVGLPFIGFAAVMDVSTGVNRAGAFEHKVTRGQ